MRRILALCLLLCALALPARADDVCQVDADAVAQLTTDCSYVQVSCSVEGSQNVTLTVTDAMGQCVYQSYRPACEGRFTSDRIYLPATGGATGYSLTISGESLFRAVALTRTVPRLTGNSACSAGYPLAWLSGGSTWQHATLLDIASLEGNPLSVPLLAGGAYTLGTVTFSVSGGRLTVSVWTEPSADCAVESASVQVALSAVEAQQLGTASFHGLSGALNAPIQLGGAPYAAVCLRMKVSFTPAGLPGCSTAMLSGQDVLWQQLLLYTSGQAVG